MNIKLATIMYPLRTILSLILILNGKLLRNLDVNCSPLAKICHDKSENICIGIYVQHQWVLANSHCKQITHKNAKVVMGNLERRCTAGETRKIRRIYELSSEENLLLLKVDTPFETENISTVKIEGHFDPAGCGAYCLQGTTKSCGDRIDSISTEIIPCTDKDGFMGKVCLKIDGYDAINNLDGSPILCNGTMIGYVKLMAAENFFTLVNASTFYKEINEIITNDAKIKPQIQHNYEIREARSIDRNRLGKSGDFLTLTGAEDIDTIDHLQKRSINILPKKSNQALPDVELSEDLKENEKILKKYLFQVKEKFRAIQRKTKGAEQSLFDVERLLSKFDTELSAKELKDINELAEEEPEEDSLEEADED